MAKILIVDDEPRIRELIHEHLQYAGYICEEAGDGSAALAQLSGGGFDLVILDLMMPFMDGMTCLREMRARHINTPVIILTARGEEYDKLAGLESGADDYARSAEPNHAPPHRGRRYHDLWRIDHRHRQPYRAGVRRGSRPDPQGV